MLSEASCEICKEHLEDSNHLFINCIGTQVIWNKMLLHGSICEHFNQFVGGMRGKKGRTFAIGIWVCVVWLIWKGRNNKIFKDVEFTSDTID